MADNTLQNGTDTIATDELATINGAAAPAGLKVQRSKIGFGADGDFKDVTATVPMPAVALQNGVVSTTNSSAVALAANAAFTGTSEDVTEFADVRVSVFADQSSATDGLQLQQSSNGTNWDVIDSYAVPLNSGKTFSVGVSAKFFRVVYTNGATANTVFRLQVKYHKTYSKGSSVRPQDVRTNDNDMEEQLSHLMGYNGVSWDRLRSTIANGLLADVSRIVGALPAGANVIGALTANQSVNNAQIGGIVPLMGNGVTGTGSQRVTIASDNTAFAVNATLLAETTKVIGTVNPPAITKGTQSANGFSTQDLKDSGRVMVTFTATALAGVTAEALISLTPYRDLVAGTAATTFAVTAGKRLRLQSISLTLRSTSTVNVGAMVRLRMLGGAVLVGSPVHNSIGGMSSNLATAVIGNANNYNITFPDGFELSGTMQFGLTQLASAITATMDIHVTGYEY